MDETFDGEVRGEPTGAENDGYQWGSFSPSIRSMVNLLGITEHQDSTGVATGHEVDAHLTIYRGHDPDISCTETGLATTSPRVEDVADALLRAKLHQSFTELNGSILTEDNNITRRLRLKTIQGAIGGTGVGSGLVLIIQNSSEKSADAGIASLFVGAAIVIGSFMKNQIASRPQRERLSKIGDRGSEVGVLRNLVVSGTEFIPDNKESNRVETQTKKPSGKQAKPAKGAKLK